MKKKPVEDVVLKKDPVRWPRLPLEIRRALLDGVDRVIRVRKAIADDAPVKSMPIVHIVPELWGRLEDARRIDGRARPLQQGRSIRAGVELPAQTVVCNDDVVRLILVHEFAHAFELQRRAIDHIDAGASGALQLSGDHPDVEAFLEDEDHEEEMLGAPEDWFGADDARRFVRWHHESLEGTEEPMLALGLHDHLPLVMPMLRPFSIDHLDVDLEVVQRVRALRDRR